jgi:MYXO-CTERM domain-containing protein
MEEHAAGVGHAHCSMRQHIRRHIDETNLALVVPALLISSVAHADVMSDPCELSEAGDACETLMGEDGVCADTGDGILVCQPSSSSGGGMSGAGGAPSDGGDDEEPDEGGCSVRAGSASGSAGATRLALVGLFFATRRRR